MIKKLIIFTVIAALAAVFVVRLAGVQREDRAAVALERALAVDKLDPGCARVESLLSRGISANTRIYRYLDGDSTTIPPHEMLRAVIPDRHWSLPLSRAAAQDTLPDVMALLDHGANPRLLDPDMPIVPSMYDACDKFADDTAMCRLLPLVRLLVARGADIDQMDGMGYSALDIAVQSFSPTSVAALLALGAPLARESADKLAQVREAGKTACPLPPGYGTAAAIGEPAFRKNIASLLDLPWAADPATSRKTLHALVDGRPGDYPQTVAGLTVVQYALSAGIHGRAALADALVQEGFHADAAGIPESAIVLEIHAGGLQFVPDLVAHGADVDAFCEQYHQTPIEAAAQSDSLAMTSLLLGHGAKAKGTQALLLCVKAPVMDNFRETHQAYYEVATPNNVAFNASRIPFTADEEALAAKLIAAGCDVDARDVAGMNFLYFAACLDNAKLVWLAFAHGAHLNFKMARDRVTLELWRDRHYYQPLPGTPPPGAPVYGL